MTTSTPRPFTIPPDPSGLPTTAPFDRPHYVTWDWEERNGKWTKPPFRPLDGRAASHAERRDWASQRSALAAYRRRGHAGIGFVLTDDLGMVGLDWDKCRDRDTGALLPWAAEWVARFNTRTEVTPSGTGLRLFLFGTLPGYIPRGGSKKDGREVYTRLRFLTLTGLRLPGTPETVEPRQDVLDAFLAEFFPEPKPEPAPVHRGHPPASADDRAVLDRLRTFANGAKFSRLYDAGDWEGEGYPSRSEARAALCSMIGFGVNRDPASIERLFEGSALYDPKKWARERDNVLRLASRGEAYDWAKDAPPPPVSTLDTPDCPAAGDDLDALLALPHDELARVALLNGRLADERGRRLDAIDELMTEPNLTEVEKVAAYVITKAAAVAQAHQDKDAPAELVINQKAIACDTGLSRQTIGKTLTRWTEQGYLRKEARGTGKFTKKNREIKETVIRLPSRDFTDNLVMAATWHRAPDAPKQGGNGKRCPKCNSTQRKKMTETQLVQTVTVACDTPGCDHVFARETKVIRERRRPTQYFDAADDIPTMLDLDRFREPLTVPIPHPGHPVSTVDTPPVPKASVIPPVVTLSTSGHPPASTVDTPPLADISRQAWGPASCTDCYAEGRRPVGEIWTCAACMRKRRGEASPYDRLGAD